MYTHMYSSTGPTVQPSNLLFFDVALQFGNFLLHSFLAEVAWHLESCAVIHGGFLIPRHRSITEASPKNHPAPSLGLLILNLQA